jgi:hypothetical protein
VFLKAIYTTDEKLDPMGKKPFILFLFLKVHVDNLAQLNSHGDELLFF